MIRRCATLRGPHQSKGRPTMLTTQPQLEDSHIQPRRFVSLKQSLLSRFPNAAIYARYSKALFRGEVELRLLPWLCSPTLTTVDIGAHDGLYTLATSLDYTHIIVFVLP